MKILAKVYSQALNVLKKEPPIKQSASGKHNKKSFHFSALEIHSLQLNASKGIFSQLDEIQIPPPSKDTLSQKFQNCFFQNLKYIVFSNRKLLSKFLHDEMSQNTRYEYC